MSQHEDNNVNKRSKLYHNQPLNENATNKNVTKKFSPALKRKRKLQKKAKLQAVTSKKQRDFSNDLEIYLLDWKSYQESKEDNSWKFNKILQNWSLDNCLDKHKINKKVFKLWLSYLLTIKGGAIDRLQSKINNILETNDNEIINDDSDNEADNTNNIINSNENDHEIGYNSNNKDLIKKSMKSRAKKIHKLIKQDFN